MEAVDENIASNFAGMLFDPALFLFVSVWIAARTLLWVVKVILRCSFFFFITPYPKVFVVSVVESITCWLGNVLSRRCVNGELAVTVTRASSFQYESTYKIYYEIYLL